MSDCSSCSKSFTHKGTDCGYHFINWNGSIDKDLQRETACNKFGRCMFYEEVKKSKEDCILELIDEIDKLNFTTEEKVAITDIIHNYYEEKLAQETHDNLQSIIDSVGVIEYDGITGRLDEIIQELDNRVAEQLNKILGGVR